MKRAAWVVAFGGLAALGAYACKGQPSPPSPAMPVRAPPFVLGPQPPPSADDDVWGVADLHAHPASHLAFGGLNGGVGLIWGSPALPDGTLAAVPGGDLPDSPPCDPETHDSHVTDAVSRTTRAEVFGLLTSQANFPHTAHGGAADDRSTPYESWPTGRDVLHQQMNVQALRRAWEGGLRLIFASTVESQAIGLAMRTTVFPPPFVPTREAERQSAEAQIVFIRNQVSANSGWMEIAATPDQAVEAIKSGHLAVVLALEMDGLLLSDVRDLVSLYGVGSIIPVHLVDNDVGGTAAFLDIFTGGTWLLGSMFGYPNRFISVQTNPDYGFHFGWPNELGIVGPTFNVTRASYAQTVALGYWQDPLCNGMDAGVPPSAGSINSVGLREPQTIRELMKMGVMIDVAHMGFRSTLETIGLARSMCGYPLLDTHTNVHFHDQDGTGDERALNVEHAKYVAEQGVLGLGSTGRINHKTCSPKAGGFDTIASARGGPLTSLRGNQGPVVIAFPHPDSPKPRACSPPFSGTASSIVIQAATSDKTGSAPGYVRIGFDDRQQIAKPFPLNAPLTIDLGGEQVGSIAWIDVGLMDGSSCGYGGSGVDLDSVDIAVDGTTLNIGRPQLGSDGSGSTLASLSGGRSSFNVYSRCPAEDDGTCEPTQKYLHTSPATLAHLRIRLKPGGGTSLRSQSALAHGARVTGALCAKPDCSDVTDKCVGAAVNASPMTVDPHRHFTVTPAGGWPGGQEIDQYVAYDPGAIGKVAAVALCISERDLAQETLEIDEIDVDDVQDPIRTWAADYDDLQKQVFANTDGKIALGTDENGLSSQFQFSDFVPSYAVDGASCGTTTGGAGIAAAQYGDADRGGVYTLERPLRIGSTPLCLPTRGMASYGMLPEVFAAVYRQDTNAYRSLFRSASGLIKAWRATRAAAFAATTNVLSCPDDGGAVDGALEGGAPDALGDSASGDGGADQ